MAIDGITTIGVVGAGQMGRGIAQVLASAGWQVHLVDVAEQALDQAIAKIRHGVMKAVEKGTVRRDQSGAVMERIQPMTRLEPLRDAQLVIEAIQEDPAMKRELFSRLGMICGPKTVLASNTSSISIASLGKASRRPDRVVGVHFMNPVPVM